jgi:hypothetical protein
MAVRRLSYRLKQFFFVITASIRPVDIEYVKARLPSPGLYDLFTSLPRLEQNHGIAVCKALELQGMHSSDLITAALLHDVGKIKHFPRLWDRVFTVLFSFVTPHRALEMAEGPPRGVGRGLVIHHHHAGWGADLAKRAGASPRTVFLIGAHHSAPVNDVELSALQAVDDG